ncbi:helix-turn-helix transcriptional regulator [Saccharibacillus alkalitolerans]|uniref:YafY family transcriptional regulator n=1 Tax=Saccharibacillus alkalitolerans TaxID=2705290 RepID=A0ABX0FA29_9BACL|nr:YafY family protein [Saccharibacillus alkalitolerans]NGZ76894.1 YafY family transcriptional regulator [Saccharibacillus alkalitolerans]
MNKSERLNRMQRYVYRKRVFTLRQLMDEFGISRSTALRDVESLEAIGLPLYADRGRGGGYRVLETASLPPVSFTTGEVLALYFAMQNLRGMSGDPFRVSFDSIRAKFLDVVSEPQREQIQRFEHRIAFEQGEPANAGAHLETLLQAAVRGEVLTIAYAGRTGEGKQETAAGGRTRRIQPFAVYASDGFWYCRAYDLDKRAYRVFRCDRIVSAEPGGGEPIAELQALDLRDAQSLRRPSAEAVSFRCSVAPEAADRLRRRLYPSMTLTDSPEANGLLLLSGSYEPRETDFIVSYLAGFGPSLKILEPESLRDRLRAYYLRRIEEL